MGGRAVLSGAGTITKVPCMTRTKGKRLRSDSWGIEHGTEELAPGSQDEKLVRIMTLVESGVVYCVGLTEDAAGGVSTVHNKKKHRTAPRHTPVEKLYEPSGHCGDANRGTITRRQPAA